MTNINNLQRDFVICFFCCVSFFCISTEAHDGQEQIPFSAQKAHAPTPLPDRVTLTWEDDPATSQSVTWRTDTSVQEGQAQLAIANANGRALQPETFEAETTFFKSDINDAYYHSVKFQGLQPDTLYTYRVGNGMNWTEYYHFKTASHEPKPFSFIYFGDAQNEVRTHWSRVFREAFRDAPRASFTLHAGDLVDYHYMDSQWGEWHQGPDWVNGTVPIIATAGNHEYRSSSAFQRIWKTKKGQEIDVDVVLYREKEPGIFLAVVRGPEDQYGTLEFSDPGKDGIITDLDSGVEEISGYSRDELIGTAVGDEAAPLGDKRRMSEEVPLVSSHWRPQFAFPVQDLPDERLAETLYYIDYQGVRIISLDSNIAIEEQVPWLRNVLENNPNKWTVVTFHHPVFSPASDRDNPVLRQFWKPLLDEFRVDIVLSGHDHIYARTGDIDVTNIKNIPTGYQQAYDPDIGTVYVVSVSGPKMYEVTKGQYAKRFAENTQLYQIIDLDGNTLRFRAFTATGDLYDEFKLRKREGKPNLLIEGTF